MKRNWNDLEHTYIRSTKNGQREPKWAKNIKCWSHTKSVKTRSLYCQNKSWEKSKIRVRFVTKSAYELQKKVGQFPTDASRTCTKNERQIGKKWLKKEICWNVSKNCQKLVLKLTQKFVKKKGSFKRFLSINCKKSWRWAISFWISTVAGWAQCITFGKNVCTGHEINLHKSCAAYFRTISLML